MSGYVKCPRCGGTNVQLSNQSSKHGCIWFILFGAYYLAWLAVKWTIGLMFLLFIDWWMAIIKAALNKGYVWHSSKWFSFSKKTYYCHNCGYNFRA